MIGEALYNLLSTQTTINSLIDGRVYPVKFAQAEVFPSLAFNTRGLRSIGCRSAKGTKEGLLEIGILAKDSVQLESVWETVNGILTYYEGVHLGYAIRIEPNTDDFDEFAGDISAYYKSMLFDLTVTKL